MADLSSKQTADQGVKGIVRAVPFLFDDHSADHSHFDITVSVDGRKIGSLAHIDRTTIRIDAEQPSRICRSHFHEIFV